MFEALLNFDKNILLWIQDVLRSDLLTWFFVLITKLGDAGAIWIFISFGLLFYKKTRTVGYLALCSLGTTFILNNLLLKNLVGRIRPYEVISKLELLIEKQSDLSFPSGHAGSSFAGAVILFLCLPKRYGLPALILAFLISYSRLYVGVHYPSDVFCGAIIGTVIAAALYYITMVLQEKNKREKKQEETL